MNTDHRPLNGSRTHPLSPHAIEALKLLNGGPIPAHKFNPGVVNRLLREGSVEIVDLPSPYPTAKGRRIQHLRLKEGSEV